VRVHVPAKIDAAPPVLVLFDGQNVFDDHGSYAGGWHAHDAIARLPSTVRRPVVVAIDHGHERRIHELWEDLDAMLHFVRERAVPEAEHRVQVHFDPLVRVIGGASMGGLASLAALARHRDWLAGAIAMSPSAWVAPQRIGHELVHARFHDATRIYVDVGRRESAQMVRESERLASLLAHRLPAGQLLWRPDRAGRHRERDWRRRLPKALRFAFRK
jgi:enterochelin esterase-like enzyme